MTDQEKDCAKNLLNNGMPNTNSVSTADLRRIKRCLYGLTVVVAAGDVILIVVVAVLFGNLKHDIENHTHKPKVGEQINKILKREELCLPCDQIRLGPSLEEDMMLDAFVRKHSTDGEQCCVETPSQLLRMLELVNHISSAFFHSLPLPLAHHEINPYDMIEKIVKATLKIHITHTHVICTAQNAIIFPFTDWMFSYL
ncbi:hypothetical protein ACJMK2_018763 [Sinanodonta woodiana]|uniref:Uncharacterized protein n=1 Tax=Sinanodonta woodiana TaxID=1069815 RepID=A0ABD3UFW2_SINWO